jgi:ribonuclease HI
MRLTQNCEVYIDGASRGNPGPAGIGVVFIDGQTTPLHEFAKYIGQTTNNVAEYLALIYALQEALKAHCTELTVKTDSELLARQISGQYRVRDVHLKILYDLAQHLRGAFMRCSVYHIPREQNVLADRLAAKAAASQGLEH